MAKDEAHVYMRIHENGLSDHCQLDLSKKRNISLKNWMGSMWV
jgi:hypothetical protein